MPMKVINSSNIRWNHFNLAKQLQKRGLLLKLISVYPAFLLEREGIKRNLVASLPWPELIFRRGIAKVPGLNGTVPSDYLYAIMFDGMARKHVRRCDLFVGWSSFSLLSMRAAKAYGAKTVLERGSSHILYQYDLLREEYEKHGLKCPIDKRLVQRELEEYAEADYIAIPSAFAKRTFVDKGVSEDKLLQVPYGVDLGEFGRTSKTDSVFRVIFVGALSLRKGIIYLLEAVSRLNLRNFELVLVGRTNGELRRLLNNYDGKYRHVGFLGRKDLCRYYGQSSVFVLPSLEEGMAKVTAEAMACGLPVIVSENSGADFVRDGIEGFVVPIRNVDALCEKIAYFYDNPRAREEMGAEAARRVVELTWDNYGDRIISLYEHLLSQRSALA